MIITLQKRMIPGGQINGLTESGVATPPASPATGIGMPVRGVALGVLVRARSHPQGVPQTARCHPTGGAVQDSPSAEQDRAAGSLRGAWGLVARPSALWLPKSPSRPPLGAAGGPCLCRRHTRRLSPPRLRLMKIEWPSGARRRWACPNGCSQPPLRGDAEFATFSATHPGGFRRHVYL